MPRNASRTFIASTSDEWSSTHFCTIYRSAPITTVFEMPGYVTFINNMPITSLQKKNLRISKMTTANTRGALPENKIQKLKM